MFNKVFIVFGPSASLSIPASGNSKSLLVIPLAMVVSAQLFTWETTWTVREGLVTFSGTSRPCSVGFVPKLFRKTPRQSCSIDFQGFAGMVPISNPPILSCSTWDSPACSSTPHHRGMAAPGKHSHLPHSSPRGASFFHSFSLPLICFYLRATMYHTAISGLSHAVTMAMKTRLICYELSHSVYPLQISVL